MGESPPEVSVIVVAYRSEDWLPTSLGALPAAMVTRSHEVVVVDNASPDASSDLVRERFPDAVLLAVDENLGFGQAVNLAASRARGRWLVLLNPDTEARPGSLDALVDFAQRHPEAGIVGGRTVSADGSLNPTSCFDLPTLWSRTCFALGLNSLFSGNRVFDPESIGHWARDSVREVGMVSGCVAAIRRDVFEEVGGFDRRFWMYSEDADLAVRLRARGYRPAVTPDAVVMHELGASADTAGSKRVQVLRGSVTFDRVHRPRWEASVRRWLLLLGVALRASLGPVTGMGGGGWDEARERRSDWWDGYPEVPS